MGDKREFFQRVDRIMLVIRQEWALHAPQEPMDGDDVDDIADELRRRMNMFYAND